MPHSFALGFILVTGVSIAAASPASAQAPGQSADPSSPAAQVISEKPRISIRDGRVSVTGRNVPLDWLLDEIARRADIACVRGDDAADERVSVDFDSLPIDDALRRLLAGRDAFFFYGSAPDRPATLRVVWIYASGRGRGLAPVPPAAWASTKEIEEQLRDGDPETRAAAIETLVERKRGQSLEAVLQALRDADERVRTRALYAALAAEVDLPADTLLQAFSDNSPSVRFLALGALASHPDFDAIARRALRDPSVHVKSRAEEMLAARDAASRPRPNPVQKRPPKI